MPERQLVPWSQVLAALLRWVGFREGPNNSNPWGPQQGIPNQPYCYSFSSIVPYGLGYQWWEDSTFGSRGYAYCPFGKRDAAKRGIWRYDTPGDLADLLPGDHVMFSWNNTDVADHVETVVAVYADGTFDTVGANTGSPNGVWRIRRDRKYLLGRIRNTWAPEPTPQPLPPEDDVNNLRLGKTLSGGVLLTNGIHACFLGNDAASTPEAEKKKTQGLVDYWVRAGVKWFSEGGGVIQPDVEAHLVIVN